MYIVLKLLLLLCVLYRRYQWMSNLLFCSKHNFHFLLWKKYPCCGFSLHVQWMRSINECKIMTVCVSEIKDLWLNLFYIKPINLPWNIIWDFEACCQWHLSISLYWLESGLILNEFVISKVYVLKTFNHCYIIEAELRVGHMHWWIIVSVDNPSNVSRFFKYL